MQTWPAIGDPEKGRLGGIKPMLDGMILAVMLPLVAVRAVELHKERHRQIARAGNDASRTSKINCRRRAGGGR
jgi:hypothetical protein